MMRFGYLFVFVLSTFNLVLCSYCDLVVSQESELYPPAVGGEAGSSVAIGSGWIAVGAPLSDVGTNDNQGVVHIYSENPAGEYSYSNTLKDDQGSAYDFFGQALSAQSNLLSVGVANSDEYGINAGAVHIFETDGTNWTYSGEVSASQSAGDFFGCALSYDEGRLAVGAYRYTNNSGDVTGAVFVFERSSGGVWGAPLLLEADVLYNNDYFGCAVALDGDDLLIGANDTDGNGYRSGSAYIFQHDESSWTEEKLLLASDGETLDLMGSAVALHDGIAAVGAPGEDEAGSDAGAVYIFGRDSGGSNQWQQVEKLLATPISVGAAFGSSLAMNADLLVAGAPESIESSEAAAGTVVFFEIPTVITNWGVPHFLVSDPAVEAERLGDSVAVGDNMFVAGMPGHAGSGAARIYEYSTTPVVLMSGISIENGLVRVTWSGGTEQRQILEAKTALTDVEWFPVQTNEPPTAVEGSFVEPAALNRFYRIRTEE